MNTDKYIEELAGVVALPCSMEGTLLGLATGIKVCIQNEQEKCMPNKALIHILCEAARLGWEHIDSTKVYLDK